MPIRIFGAGMAGLLTATMLRRHRPVVYEAQPELPDNHGALLRFRSDAVQEATGQAFRRVRVHKAIKRGSALDTVATLRDSNQYSFKVMGEVSGDRSILTLAPSERYIAPDDFLPMLARDAILNVNAALTLDRLKELSAETIGISTIPMPALMRMVGWDAPGFRWRAIWSVTITVRSPRADAYQTIYYPDPHVPWYRASITGHKIIVEFTEDPVYLQPPSWNIILDDFGFPADVGIAISEPKRQEYGKLVPLPDAAREEFILAMTDQYNLYSVGRFATWRQILLDDVVQDVKKVERWITQRSSYHRRLHT
jgi:hypothetical protein